MSQLLDETYSYQAIDGRAREVLTVRRDELLVNLSAGGRACMSIPFINEQSPGGELALRIPRVGSAEGLQRIRREIGIHRYLASCADEDRVNLGEAVGADLQGGTNIVVRWYGGAEPLSRPKWRDLITADRFDVGVGMVRAIVSLARVRVVHQDICPNNFVLRYQTDPSGGPPKLSLWLVDFGHAYREGIDMVDVARGPAHADWAHPHRQGRVPGTPYTDLWEAVLAWLSLWSGQNVRDGAEPLGMSLPFDLSRDVRDTISSGLDAAIKGDRKAGNEVVYALKRARIQALREIEIEEVVRLHAPTTGFELLDVKASRLEEQFIDDYRLEVKNRAREAQRNLIARLVDEEGVAGEGDTETSQITDDLILAAAAREMGEGNTLLVSSVFKPELRRTFLAVKDLRSVKSSDHVREVGEVHLSFPGLREIIAVSVLVALIVAGLIAWKVL